MSARRQFQGDNGMLKKLLVATSALALMSGVGFADSVYTHSKTESISGTPSHEVDMSKTVRTSNDGMVTEKEKTVKSRADGGDSHVTLEIGGGHDRDVEHKEKTVHKSTEVSPTGDVTRNKSVTTTIR